MSVKHPAYRYGWELKAIFAFGVAFVIVIILIAITLPRPTVFQQLIFRVVLALSAAGVGALVPGFLTIKFKNILRAGGGIAVFVIVYFFNPASLVIYNSPAKKLLPTDRFKITFIYRQQGKFISDTYAFPVSDIQKNSSGTAFHKLLGKLPNLPKSSLENSTVFRTSDERIVTKDSGNALGNGNLGVLVIPNSAIQKYGDRHLAFTHIYNQLRKAK